MEKGEKSDDEKWMYVVDAFHMPLSSQTGATGLDRVPHPKSQSWTINEKAGKLTTNQHLGFLYPLPSGFYVLEFCIDFIFLFKATDKEY